MIPFTYERASNVRDAVEAVAREPGARFIAGGTNLLDLMKLQVETPTRLVDVSRLPLADIVEAEGGLVIGSQARNSDLAAHPLVRARYPLLAKALLAGASAQIRNKATVGGNLLQRTRCDYFTDIAMPCNKREPGVGCAALRGHNRMHAVLGASDQCIAVNPSDMAVALTALDAVARTASPGGRTRDIPLAEFYRLPGDTPQIENVLSHGELITAVVLPAPALGAQTYRKVRDRASFAFALTSVAAILDVAANRVRGARIVFGGLAPRPWRAVEAERALVGRAPTRAVLVAAADAALRGAKGRGGNDFKILLAKRSLIATLSQLAEKAGA